MIPRKPRIRHLCKLNLLAGGNPDTIFQVSDYNKKEEEMEGFDPGLSCECVVDPNQRKMGRLKEEKKGLLRCLRSNGF